MSDGLPGGDPCVIINKVCEGVQSGEVGFGGVLCCQVVDV